MRYNNDDPYYMGNIDTLPVRIIFKTNYGNVEVELPWDTDADAIINTVYSIMVGMGFPVTGVLHAMKEIAEEKLSVLEPEEQNDDENEDIN